MTHLRTLQITSLDILFKGIKTGETVIVPNDIDPHSIFSCITRLKKEGMEFSSFKRCDKRFVTRLM